MCMNTTQNTQVTDLAIQQDVLDELLWVPEVDPARIGVSVHDGVVTLSGEVGSHAERIAAKDAALSVHGVTTVADELMVDVVASAEHSDTKIAEAAREALLANSLVPRDAVTVQVRDQVVTLTGTVEWNFQREAARNAIVHLPGVRFVENRIVLTARASAADAEERIRAAFERNAQLDAKRVHVSISGNIATLTGTVRSWAEKKEAAQAAWASPHVADVHNDIQIESNW